MFILECCIEIFHFAELPNIFLPLVDVNFAQEQKGLRTRPREPKMTWLQRLSKHNMNDWWKKSVLCVHYSYLRTSKLPMSQIFNFYLFYLIVDATNESVLCLVVVAYTLFEIFPNPTNIHAYCKLISPHRSIKINHNHD